MAETVFRVCWALSAVVLVAVPLLIAADLISAPFRGKK